VQRWSREGRQMFNTYGPTEATVSASWRACSRPAVTIGTPLPNYGLLVIDPTPIAPQPATAGAAGLRLLPRGERRAVHHRSRSGRRLPGPPRPDGRKIPAQSLGLRPHDARLYRTGDLARIGADGEVVCLGRADDRSKSAASASNSAKSKPCWRSNRASARSPSCCARTTASTSWSPTSCRKAQPLDPRELRTALAAKLPPYMVPGRYEMLDAMPRLTSGKIDRKALKARR
jgi:acyl-coenzyme A synthetase/AMP-(fatty) acid ligase